MMRVPDIDRITFLVNRKFPGFAKLSKNETDVPKINEAMYERIERDDLRQITKDKVKEALSEENRVLTVSHQFHKILE